MTLTKNPAAAILESLAKCDKIRFMQAGDNDTLCANDMLPILPTKSGWVHDEAAIRRYREMALEGTWPR